LRGTLEGKNEKWVSASRWRNRYLASGRMRPFVESIEGASSMALSKEVVLAVCRASDTLIPIIGVLYSEMDSPINGLLMPPQRFSRERFLLEKCEETPPGRAVGLIYTSTAFSSADSLSWEGLSLPESFVFIRVSADSGRVDAVTGDISPSEGLRTLSRIRPLRSSLFLVDTCSHFLTCTSWNRNLIDRQALPSFLHEPPSRFYADAHRAHHFYM
jgi:hypothetical protein